jgi:hypothetical protein
MSSSLSHLKKNKKKKNHRDARRHRLETRKKPFNKKEKHEPGKY